MDTSQEPHADLRRRACNLLGVRCQLTIFVVFNGKEVVLATFLLRCVCQCICCVYIACLCVGIKLMFVPCTKAGFCVG